MATAHTAMQYGHNAPIRYRLTQMSQWTKMAARVTPACSLSGQGSIDRAHVKRHVPHDELDTVAVPVLDVLHMGVQGDARLALEVEELHQLNLITIGHAWAVGTDQILE